MLLATAVTWWCAARSATAFASKLRQSWGRSFQPFGTPVPLTGVLPGNICSHSEGSNRRGTTRTSSGPAWSWSSTRSSASSRPQERNRSNSARVERSSSGVSRGATNSETWNGRSSSTGAHEHGQATTV